MSRVDDVRNAVDVNRLLAGAAKTVANVRYCWLVTKAESGAIAARPMGRISRVPDGNDWTLRFITDGRSRKAADIRRADKVVVIFQRETDDAFITLIGKAALRESAAEIRQDWKDAYNTYFPSETDRANAAFVEVDVGRMELWIRGVTPEPYGLQPTVLERDIDGGWRLSPGDRNAA